MISWYGPHAVRMLAFLKTATRASSTAPISAIVPAQAPVYVPVHTSALVSMAAFAAHQSNVRIEATRGALETRWLARQRAELARTAHLAFGP